MPETSCFRHSIIIKSMEGVWREHTPSPFSIDFGDMYVKIARFHKAMRLKTLLLSDLRTSIPQDFRGSAPPIKKGTFLMD